MTANKPMTSEQLDELMTVAVNMQRDSEKADDRPAAMFAYAVQVAVLELRKVRNHAAKIPETSMSIARYWISPNGIACEDNEGKFVKYEDYAALEARCAALAAENAGLKAICEDRRTFIMNGVQLGYIHAPTVETDPALETIRVAVSPQAPTPSTDSFLAEVRAQGVEMFSAFCGEENSVFVQAKAYYRSLPDAAYEFAEQLRKGAQS